MTTDKNRYNQLVQNGIPEGAARLLADPDEYSPASVGEVKVVTRTVTSPELLALNSSPPVLVPGVADRFLWPVSALFIFHPGTTPYVGIGGDTLDITVEPFGASLLHAAYFLLGEVGDTLTPSATTDQTSLPVSLAMGAGLVLFGPTPTRPTATAFSM